MYLTKTIWVAAIACATLLLIPALAGALRADKRALIAVAEVPAPEEMDVRLLAIEYDPAFTASYPVLGALGSPSERSF
jgi:hypothetical protein